MQESNNSLRNIIVASGVVVSALVTSAVCVLTIKNVIDKKKIGGQLIKVNYKFSKEFED